MSRSAAALRLIDFTEGQTPGLCAGDLVRTGDNRYPHYEIVAISGNRAWIRDVQYDTDHVVPVEGLHRIG
jgi:hypothetical protein